MRTVLIALVGVALVGAAFGLGRVTRADAEAPVVPVAATPVPLEAGAPVSASSVSAGPTIPALRPVPTPKPKKKTTKTSTPSGSSGSSGSTTTTNTAPPAATTAPSTSRPPTSSSPPPAKKKPSQPVEEIG